jgi:hypothetical protein
LDNADYFLQDFKRSWANYRSIYLLAKLSALMIVATMGPSNCIFVDTPAHTMEIVSQAVLFSSMFVFFIIQCWKAPFLDPVNNASEWISRINYVLTALVGLCVSLAVPGYQNWQGPVLYVYEAQHTLWD